VRKWAGVAVLFFVMACAVPKDDQTDRFNQDAFQTLIRGGITAELNMYVPERPVCPGPVPADVRDGLASRLLPSLSPFFAAPRLTEDVASGTSMLADEASTPSCLYGGGVDWVRLSAITIQGSSATATGQYRTWARVGAAGRGGLITIAEPHNTIAATFMLDRRSGAWRISSYGWRFAPGSEP